MAEKKEFFTAEEEMEIQIANLIMQYAKTQDEKEITFTYNPKTQSVGLNKT